MIPGGRSHERSKLAFATATDQGVANLRISSVACKAGDVPSVLAGADDSAYARALSSDNMTTGWIVVTVIPHKPTLEPTGSVSIQSAATNVRVHVHLGLRQPSPAGE